MYTYVYCEQRMQWREKELLELLKNERLNTSEVVKRANMSKTTTLKYLEGLKGKGLITCEMIGPTKLWSLTNARKESGNPEKKGRFGMKRIEEFIHVDQEVFSLLEEFENVTGKRLELVVNKKGITLRIQEDTA